jgi:uncharacterized membrane protein YgdD (TMEM256/DUF423 family)
VQLQQKQQQRRPGKVRQHSKRVALVSVSPGTLVVGLGANAAEAAAEKARQGETDTARGETIQQMCHSTWALTVHVRCLRVYGVGSSVPLCPGSAGWA